MSNLALPATYPNMTAEQTASINSWMKRIESAAIQLCMNEDASYTTRAAERHIKQIIDDADYSSLSERDQAEPLISVQVARALGKVLQTLKNPGDEYNTGIVDANDIQLRLAHQIIEIGRPALQLVQNFARLQSALVLLR